MPLTLFRLYYFSYQRFYFRPLKFPSKVYDGFHPCGQWWDSTGSQDCVLGISLIPRNGCWLKSGILNFSPWTPFTCYNLFCQTSHRLVTNFLWRKARTKIWENAKINNLTCWTVPVGNTNINLCSYIGPTSMVCLWRLWWWENLLLVSPGVREPVLKKFESHHCLWLNWVSR